MEEMQGYRKLARGVVQQWIRDALLGNQMALAELLQGTDTDLRWWIDIAELPLRPIQRWIPLAIERRTLVRVLCTRVRAMGGARG